MGCNSNFTDWVSDNWTEEDEVCDDDTTSVSFKKVGYWSTEDNDDIDLVDFSAFTHIVYHAISVNSDGSLVTPDDTDALEDLVDYGESNDIEIYIALGDGDDNNFNTIAESTSITNSFVNKVADFIDDYDLDGAELNWQTIGDDDESDNLEELLEELEDELGDKGYGLIMSLPSGEYSSADNIDNDMFTYVDFANIHAFDSTDSDDLHSSLEDAEDAITYWTGRCLIQNKLVLGVPFYSVDDDEDVSETLSYDEIVDDDLDDACTDESDGRNYNGIPTIMDKTSYALLYAGGMMMNAIDQDYNDDSDYSLVNAINEVSNGEYVDVCD